MSERLPGSQLAAVVSSLALALLCACMPPAEVISIPDGVVAPPKPADCTIEFFGAETLQRPYDKLAVVRVYYTRGRAGLRGQACELGADAVVGLRNMMTADFQYLVGTAVRYR
jgi:hypothetical protein